MQNGRQHSEHAENYIEADLLALSDALYVLASLGGICCTCSQRCAAAAMSAAALSNSVPCRRT